MRLRRVVISGFKTFARRSEIVMQPGITAIVGPNGSGKSNLVDAIRWALGETNARELRGQRMDEVIFAGSGGRGRMGFAEVELILDNEDSGVALEDPEISVSRRVVRGGDSDYRLNGERIRLRDLERVLGNTGLTQSGYAVVAQNDIDGIIEATPAQRRALVEQAAGVRSLRAATEDALGRVGTAEITLRRYEDLLEDAEPRLAELAAQAATALEQRELTERLTALRGSLAREAWRAARAQLKQARRREEAARSRLEAATVAAGAFERRLGEERGRLDEARRRRQDAARRLEDARVDTERAAGEARRWGDRRRSAALQRAATRAEIEVLTSDLAAAEQLSAELARSAAELDAARQASDGQLAELRERHQQGSVLLGHAEQRLGAVEAALAAAEKAHLAAQTAAVERSTQLQLFQESAAGLDREAAEARDRCRALGAEQRQVQAAEEDARRCADSCAAALAAAQERVQSCREAVAAAEAAVRDAQVVSRAAVARAAEVRGQVEGALGGAGAVAAAVAEGRLAARRLVECFQVADPDDGPAVEAALEDHLGAWVVDDPDAVAALLHDEAGREELLRAGLQPPAETPAPAGARRVIDALAAIDPAAEGALRECLQGIWLAPDAAVAQNIVAAGQRAVLGDGSVLSRAGRRGGGRPGQTLELAAAEAEAADAAAQAVAAEERAGAALEAARAALGIVEAEDRAAATALQEARAALAEVAARHAGTAATLRAESQRLSSLEASITARDRQRSALEEAGSSSSARLRAAEEALAAARASTDAERKAVAVARAAAVAAEEALRSGEADAGQVQHAAIDAARRLDVARQTAAMSARRLQAARVRLVAAESDVLVAIVRGRTAATAAAGSEATVAAALQALETEAPQLAEAERAVASLEVERSEVAIALARAEDETAAAAAEAAECDERVAELAEAVRGDDEDEGPEPDAKDAVNAEREIVRLERRIAALGPVNGLAPEQHEILERRVSVLRASRDDLGGACADIRALAGTLKVEIENRFDAVFGAVTYHFHQLFGELFPGGKATLRLEDPEPVAEDGEVVGRRRERQPGVEILAQPPGKRLQPLSLLSGGERALTALAVILALQQVNPSPFYVFDEVDAPLDDSNVVRFTKLLQRLAETQQFIVVTHNHVTMAKAAALYGVTAGEDGISTVLSVRFDAGEESVAEGEVVGLRQSTIRAAS